MRIFTLLGIFLSMIAHAAEYSLVISAGSPVERIDQTQLRNLFLHKRSYFHQQKIIPVNLLADNAARKVFESNVLKMNRQRLNAYWVKQHYKGVSPPVTQASYSAVKRFVTKVEGAIGYIPSSMVDESVKVLYEF